MNVDFVTDLELTEFDLVPELKRGLETVGFKYCTPIQAAALPLALAGTNVAGQARTGTGKTAAYLLVAMDRILRSARGAAATGSGPRRPRVVVIAPTRELAIQIHKDAEDLGQYTGLRFGVVYGGTGYDSQREMVRAGLDVLVGTPGRMIDYLKQKLYTLAAVEVAILDEADRMFDLGFIRDIRFLLRRLPAPEARLNLMFSATLTHRVMELAYEHMGDVTVLDMSRDQVTVKEVTQTLYHVSKEEKIPLLLGLLAQTDATRSIIFVNTRRGAERVSDYLQANGYENGLLSGDVPQRKRLSLLSRFHRGALPILVATDVAARGLHIPDVSHIFNFDLPQDAEDYVHRIGRTARAGALGNAISFACEEYVFSLTEIEEYIGGPIPTRPVTDAMLVAPRAPARRRRSVASRPRSGRRGPRPARTGSGAGRG